MSNYTVKFNNMLSQYNKSYCYGQYIALWISIYVNNKILNATYRAYVDSHSIDDGVSLFKYLETEGFVDGTKLPSKEEFIANDFYYWAVANEIERFMFDCKEYDSSCKLEWVDIENNRQITIHNVFMLLFDDPKTLIDYFKDQISLMKEYAKKDFKKFKESLTHIDNATFIMTTIKKVCM